MRVLLTGGSGFLGRYVQESLLRHSIETVMLGRNRSTGSDSFDFIEADLLVTQDIDSLVKRSGATHLLHLAWYAEHGKYWTSPFNLRWVEATIRLVEAFCQAGGRQVVVAGTCAEYDWSYGYCREDATPLNPTSYYGVAKDAARRLVMALCAQYNVTCSWGRIFLPYGAGEDCQRLIPSLVEVFRDKRLPFGVNAAAYRDFLHASDVAEGFTCLLHSSASGAFNVSSNQPVKLGDVVLELARRLNSDPQTVLNLTPERLGEPPLVVGDNLKLKALGWKPVLTLEQGLAQSVSEMML